MQLFYNPNVNAEDNEVIFSKDESKHIVKVLRKQEGDLLNVTNGKGNIFKTKITLVTPQKCISKVLEVEIQPKDNYYLHLAVAPTKMNDRFEWFLEKATEIGIHEITPLICDHSERKVIKLNRFERVIQSAMKQALHFRIPKLNDAVNASDFIVNNDFEHKFIAHCEDGEEKVSLKSSVKKDEKTVILIGPEGDFSLKEIQLALENNWQPVSLGNSRLRTETAAIVACHTVALANED